MAKEPGKRKRCSSKASNQQASLAAIGTLIHKAEALSVPQENIQSVIADLRHLQGQVTRSGKSEKRNTNAGRQFMLFSILDRLLDALQNREQEPARKRARYSGER